MENPQTERETVSAELGLFSDEAYQLTLTELTPDELRVECFRQFKLSGEMLDKYRVASQKSENWKLMKIDAQNEARMWAGVAKDLEKALQGNVERFTAIQVMVQESKGYTHNALEIVRRLINDAAQRAIDAANVALDRIHEAKHRSPQEYFDLPF